MSRLLSLIAVAGLCACIDKPTRPSDRADGGPPDGDGGIDRDAGSCDNPPDERTPWDVDDVVRFEQIVAQLNGDCRDDIIVPGAVDNTTHGVFVILGRDAPDFFTGGYDHFIPTDESQPLRVAATNLVGGPPLDLVVFARRIETPFDEAEVLVFEGVGDGSFLGDAISRSIGGSEIVATGPDESAPLVLETTRAASGDPVSLLIGDRGATYLVSPLAWNRSGLEDAQVTEPFGASPGAEGVVTAPSGRAGENDLVKLGTSDSQWFVSLNGDAYGPGALQAMLDNGPRLVRAPDAATSTDIAGVSAQGDKLTFLFLTQPGGVDESGGIEVEPFSIATLAAPDSQLEAVEAKNLGGGDAPELVVLDGGTPADDDAVVWVFHDVASSGGMVEPARDADPVAIGPGDDSHPFNRMVMGTFRAEGVVEIYLFTSAPGLRGPICRKPMGDPDTLTACD